MSGFRPAAEREEPYRDAERTFRTSCDFPREGRVWTDVLDHLRPAAVQAKMATTECEILLSETSALVERIAGALGWTGADGQSHLSLNRLWEHATDRELQGWEPCRVEWGSLMAAYTKYKQRTLWQTAYLDWVFLDAMLYAVIYKLVDDIHHDILRTGETRRWLLPVQRMYRDSSDHDKEHPLLLETKLTLQHGAFRLLPTALILAVGVGCFYVEWWTAGWSILGLFAIWRAYRFVRWLARIGPRRRAWKAVNRLADGYQLLAAQAIPTQELHRVIDDAREIFGRSSVLGGDFWAVLDDVCGRHPVNLISAEVFLAGS